MKNPTITTLADEARAELVKDNSGPRYFAGNNAFAAEFAYFRAMRDGRVEFLLDGTENEKRINEVAHVM